ncbi:prepilin-type N-terminal cleavage/methylation domain-containing protein [Verrucomicrobium sp. BvORR034]|uniref:prepilin-type N-terminal cleavage/methylation domain-containing protein n=1 Tax=Verrucomicrobium sp. BvORR034 TaxID=1396418 RepID=UPI0006789143|nr:prepilin-type N-terminal cleavage/methylation domain-containing protein [Verrucomicrobium sp. BvORR034]
MNVPPAGFTLLELLVTMIIVAILATLMFVGMQRYRGLASGASCSSNLRQLSAAVNLYVSDNNGMFPAYVSNGANGERTWYFGHESTPAGTSEGNRDLDQSGGPLFPYIQEVGKIEVCQGFNYGNSLWKPKFKGASYGYGYNWILGGRSGGSPMSIAQLKSASKVILFGDCAQINTFQKPATPKKPMLEEFYIINETEKTVHFRHNGRANMLFVDGHVESFSPWPGTEDRRISGEVIGRITKRSSLEYLR